MRSRGGALVCVCVRACGGGEGTLAGRTEHVRLEESELEAASAAEEERGVRSRAAMGRQGGMAGSIRSACQTACRVTPIRSSWAVLKQSKRGLMDA